MPFYLACCLLLASLLGIAVVRNVLWWLLTVALPLAFMAYQSWHDSVHFWANAIWLALLVLSVITNEREEVRRPRLTDAEILAQIRKQ